MGATTCTMPLKQLYEYGPANPDRIFNDHTYILENTV